MSKEPLTEATPLKGGETVESKTWHSFWDKHQWVVVASVALLVAIATVKTQITAFLFSYSDVPTAYSFYSCIVTCVLLLPIFILEWCGVSCMGKQWGVPTWKTLPSFGLICFFLLFDLMFTNIALAEIPAAVQACIAATNPFWALTLESIIYRKLHNILVYSTVVVIVIGTVLTVLAESEKSTAWGVIAAIVAVFSSSAKYVFTHKAFKDANQGPDKLTPLALLFWVDLVLFPIYALISGVQGELKEMFILTTADASIFFQFTGTAALGGIRAYTQFNLLSFVSATSLAVAATATTCFNIYISMTWQDMDITAMLVVGSSITILFAAFYAYLKTDQDSPLIKATSWEKIRCCLGMPPLEPEKATP